MTTEGRPNPAAGYKEVGWAESVYVSESLTLYECQTCYALVGGVFSLEKHTAAVHSAQVET